MNASAITHPTWCDPRRCVANLDNVEHRSTGMTLRPRVADVELTISLSRLDEHGPCAELGDTRVLLVVTDVDGTSIAVDLNSPDTRLVMAALGCQVDELDALAAQAVAR